MEQLELKAKLYQKVAAARIEIQKQNIQKEGKNSFDKYSYFSEAQYKKIITQILLDNRIELSSSVLSVESIDATAKQPIGARVVVSFELIDIDTGYSQSQSSAGDGIDKGDKGIYKAMTGAFKYFVANNFLITTGDDSEKHSQDEITEPLGVNIDDANLSERDNLIKLVTEGGLIFKKTDAILETFKVKAIEELTTEQLKIAKAKLDKEGA